MTDLPTLRPATADDAEAVAELWHRGWHDAHAGHVPAGLTAARTRAAFGERVPGLLPRTTVAAVAGSEGGREVAGFVMVVGDEVEQLFVAGPHRGTGLAGLLLDEGERLVAAQGHDEAWLAVVDGNARARRFYERRGWRDGGDLPYEVDAGGTTYVSPCRRYLKRVR
jgi:GNAT superfamily N-acetyltransferase